MIRRRWGVSKRVNKLRLELHSGTGAMNLSEGSDRIGNCGSYTARCSGPNLRRSSAGVPVGVTNKLQATIMVIVAQDDEQRLELASEPVTNDLIDQGQVLVVEGGRKGVDSLNEGVGALTISGGPWWHSHEQWAWTIALDVVLRAWVRSLVDAAQLTKDSDTNLRLQSDLVPKTDTFETWWTSDWMVMTEETREEIPQTFGCVG